MTYPIQLYAGHDIFVTTTEFAWLKNLVIVAIDLILGMNFSASMLRTMIFPRSLTKEVKDMTCEHIDTCPIITRKSKLVPFTVNSLKIKYCEFNKNNCVRYKLLDFSEIEDIPIDLWPGDEMREMELLEMKLNESRQKLYGCSREEIPPQFV